MGNVDIIEGRQFHNCYHKGSFACFGGLSINVKVALDCFVPMGNIDIMRTEQYLLKDLDRYFKRHKIATVEQLQKTLGNPKERTVFRKLKLLDYLSSYSHRGKYYTLKSISEFNADGLWSHRSVWFSHFGSLLDTARAFVDDSDAGYTAAELEKALHVETRGPLVTLFRAGRLEREKLQGSYVYFA